MSLDEFKEKDIKELGIKLQEALTETKKLIFGQDDVIKLALVSCLCEGHTLLVGVPGLAKTLLVKTLATILGVENKRIQFTPDLMPSDIIGSEIFEEGENNKKEFRFAKGPVFCNLLMADEINRASPRTQSALLQGMQEGFVTLAGKKYDLPKPFLVLATQNPIEQEGTYPLPEAQLDRFLMQINISYPKEEAEKEMIDATTGAKEPDISPILNSQEIIKAQKLIREIPIGEDVIKSVLRLVRQSRPETSDNKEVLKYVSWGAGPRASQAFVLALKAKAVLENRLSPSKEDIKDLAVCILQHRMALNFTARAENIDIKRIIKSLCAVI